MSIETPLIFGLFSPTAVVFGVLGILVITVFFLSLFIFLGWVQIRRIAFSDTEAEKLKREAFRTAAKVVSEARAEALHMLEETQGETRELLKKAERTIEIIEEETRTALKGLVAYESRRIEEAYEDLRKVYQDIATNTKEVFSKAIEGVAADATQEIRVRLLRFQGELKNESLRYQKEMAEYLKDLHREMEKEAEEYKQEAIKRVHSSIYDVLFFVSKRVFGRALDLEAHEELVMMALEEAKKSGMFIS